MTSPITVRRVRLHEWRQVRDLRIEATGDPAASIAFLTTAEEERSRDDEFWRERTAGAALGETAAQFIADTGERWVGTATVLIREPGTRDHLGVLVTARRADVVGVYVAPAHRGTGVLSHLFAAAADWVRDAGIEALMLDVHRDNDRARRAYTKVGFVPTGVAFTGAIGPEVEMRLAL